MKLAPILLLAACGGARVIQMTPTGGVLELQGDRAKAMDSAAGQMDDKCGKDSWTIVDEAEEAVAPNKQATHIHFQCNGAAPQPPAH
jgi:hypothetical protein